MSGVLYRTSDGNDHVAAASLTIVCEGMYSNLRSKLIQPQIQQPSYFVGLLLKGCSLPHANHGHVVLAKPAPILFYPISSVEVRTLTSMEFACTNVHPRRAHGVAFSEALKHIHRKFLLTE